MPKKSDVTRVDLERMSAEAGIPREIIMRALGLPKTEIKTAADAEDAYYRAIVGTPEEKEILRQWRPLYLKELKKVKTPDEAREMYRGAPTKIEAAAAMRLWESLSLLAAKKAKTANDARQAYEEAPDKSLAEKTALRKWIKLCKNQDEAREAFMTTSNKTGYRFLVMSRWLSFCASFNEALNAYRQTEDGERAEQIAMRKLLSFCKNTDQANLAFLKTKCPRSEEMAKKKWRQISAQMIADAKNRLSTRQAFVGAPIGSPEKSKALFKWLSFCETVNDIIELHENTTGMPEHGAVLQKWRAISRQMIGRAINREDCRALYGTAPGNTPEKRALLRKWLSFCTDVDDMRDVYNCTVNNTLDNAIVVKAMAKHFLVN